MRTRKYIVAVALLAVAGTTFVAPYSFTLHDDVAEAAIGGKSTREARYYASMWDSSSRADAIDQDENRYFAMEWDTNAPPYYVDRVEDAHLDVGQLGLWWLGIAAATGIAIRIAAWRRHNVNRQKRAMRRRGY